MNQAEQMIAQLTEQLTASTARINELNAEVARYRAAVGKLMEQRNDEANRIVEGAVAFSMLKAESDELRGQLEELKGVAAL